MGIEVGLFCRQLFLRSRINFESHFYGTFWHLFQVLQLLLSQTQLLLYYEVVKINQQVSKQFLNQTSNSYGLTFGPYKIHFIFSQIPFFPFFFFLPFILI